MELNPDMRKISNSHADSNSIPTIHFPCNSYGVLASSFQIGTREVTLPPESIESSRAQAFQLLREPRWLRLTLRDELELSLGGYLIPDEGQSESSTKKHQRRFQDNHPWIKLTRAGWLISTVNSTPIHVEVIVQLINSIIITKQRNFIPIMDIRKGRLEFSQRIGFIVGRSDTSIRKSLNHCISSNHKK